MRMPTAVRRAPTAPSPAPLASRSRLRSVLLALVAGLSTSGLLWLGHFPVAWGWLAWVALVPWLLLVRTELPRRTRYPIAWLAGLAFFVPALSWMRVAHDAMFWSWLGLALYCSWYFPLARWL